MSKPTFIINGVAQSGKDTFVNFFRLSYFVENYSTIDDIKKWAVFIGYNFTKTDKDRKLLSELKRIANEYIDYSFNELKAVIDKFEKNDYREILFIHIREVDEIKRVKEVYPYIKTILIKNDRVPIPDNESDQQVFNYDYDYIIENNSTLKDLEKKVKEFIKEIK